MTAALRESSRKSERGSLASWPQQVCDLDCSRIQDGVRGRLWGGTKFKIKLAVREAQLVYRVRRKCVLPAKTKVKRGTTDLGVNSRERIRLVEEIRCSIIVVSEIPKGQRVGRRRNI